MALTASQLADLRGKAKLVLGISDDDPAFLVDALAVYDDLTNNTTSTIEVTGVNVRLVGDDSGTSTITFTSLTTDTLGDLIDQMLDANANLQITPLVDTDEVAATDLVRRASVSIAGQVNEVTLQAENNALLDLLIEGTLAGIEAYLGRDLLSQSYTERVFPNGDGIITLDQPNVTSVDVLGLEPSDAITVTYTGSDTVARVEVTDTACVLRSSSATTTTTTLAFSTYDDTAQLAAAIDGTSGWSATSRVTVPTSRLVRSPSWDAKTSGVELQYWEDWDGEYEIDYREGQIRLRYPSWGSAYGFRGMGYVAYTAGYDTLPRDIEQVVLSLIKSSYDGTKRDGSVVEESLGDYSYKLAQDAVSGGVSSASISAQLPVLGRYRRMLP